MNAQSLLLLAAAGIFPFLLNLILTPLLMKIAHHKEWYDDVDHRKIHTGDIPRIGGVGIFAASVITILIALGMQGRSPLMPDISPQGCVVFIVGLAIIHLVGLLDDFANLRPLYKLYGQILAALIIVVFGYSFHNLYLPVLNTTIPLGFTGPILTFLWILGVTNAVNLIDGLDGLSGTIAALGALFMGFGAAAIGSLFPALFSFALFGALVAFLVFNLPPAKIFMGDSGSMFLGYFLATIPLFAFTSDPVGQALPFAMTLVLIPVLDTVGAIIRRKRKKEPFHAPDKEHLHHKLLQFGWTNQKILITIALASILLGTTAFFWIKTDNVLIAHALFMLWLLSIVSFGFLHKAHRAENPYKKTAE